MYKVTCLYDGTTYVLHDPESDDLRVYNDEVETEDNAPGSFTFTFNFDHPYLQYVCGQQSDIRVYDGDEEIFRGRPIDDGEDLYRERSFKCEGELAFLYDSIQPRREIHDITPYNFFKMLIDEHNAQVQNTGMIDKTFTVGVVTVTDTNDSLYRYTNFETTYDAIMDKMISRLGGHLHVRIENGVRYLDLLKDVSTISNQPIQLGENLLSYARDTDYTQIATACIPLGAHLDESEIAALDAYLDIKSVNGGSNMLQITEAVNRYGFICKVVHFDDITVPANLKTKGQEWLQEGQYATLNLDLTAVDLHTIGVDVQPIRVNTSVHVLSEPHGMDRWFEVAKRTYHLTQPDADTVSFGVTDRQRSYTSKASQSAAGFATQFEEMHQDIIAAVANERQNISNILNLATHGYVVLDPNDGPERILIMDTDSVDTAQKIWKWDMNGLGYSSHGINGPWETAITMNGEISADFIVVGELMASLIKTGKIESINGRVYFDLDNNEIAASVLKSPTKPTSTGGDTILEVGLPTGQGASSASSYVFIYPSGYRNNALQISGSSSGSYDFTAPQDLVFRGRQIQMWATMSFLFQCQSGSNYCSVKSNVANQKIEISYNLDVDHQINCDILVQSSDKRLKHDISVLPEVIAEAIGEVDIVQFKWNKDPDSGFSFGVVAQEVEQKLIDHNIDVDYVSVVSKQDDDYMSVNYNSFLVARIAYDEKRIKEQQSEIEDLKSRVDRLEKIIERMGV